jgi:hypothetical protein
MEEFIEKLNYYFESAKPEKLSTIPHISRIPQIDFSYGEVPPLRKFTDKFFDVIKFQYGSSELSNKLKIAEVLKSSDQVFILLKEYLESPYSLQNAILEASVGTIGVIKPLLFFSRLIFFPSDYDLEDYKKGVENIDMKYYGRLIKTEYIKLDFYSDMFNDNKAREFLNIIPERKAYSVSLVSIVLYPPEKNHEFKNILLQILLLKDGLLPGGIIDTKMDLTSKVDDILILLSRIFGKVQFCLQIISFGIHGVRIYAKDFKGISDELYVKLKEGIFGNSLDIKSMFKVQHKLTNSEELSIKLDKQVDEIIEMYEQNKDLILKNVKQLDEARLQRTLDDIYQYFIQED